ncbi:hypothetical protein E3N88_08780 [Mikania micrantha]|uniref:Cupin type-1 domain-containing protein n=1 Tax=Mikania micrantha TaxID=192012 RepID=A0A5N6PHA2_9ASTR|nr:hypothetical protein E3N88_08780 [Mikania micrantha]
MWKQSHCRKGSRPLDKDLSSSSSHVSDVDSEENIKEENLVWVDERAKETWVKYDGYLVEKYGNERSNHPKFDEVSWSRAVGGIHSLGFQNKVFDLEFSIEYWVITTRESGTRFGYTKAVLVSLSQQITVSIALIIGHDLQSYFFPSENWVGLGVHHGFNSSCPKTVLQSPVLSSFQRGSGLPFLLIAINFLRPSFLRILRMNSPVFSVSPEFIFQIRSSSLPPEFTSGSGLLHAGSSSTCRLLLASYASFAFASDPSPLQDFCVADPNSPVLVNGVVCKDPKLVQADDFLFRGLNLMRNTSNDVGSNVTAVTVAQLPGLNTFGISMARIDFAPMGINPPHTHPRATEILTVIEGRILVGFVTSNPENRLITKVLEKGDVFVFPEGLIHFQKNLGHGYALALAALSSQNPGVITIANGVFGSNPDIPADVLAKAFQTDINVVYQIQSKF